MTYLEESVKPTPSFKFEENDKGQRIPVSPNILKNYQITPNQQNNPSPIQIAVAALLEVNKAYLIKHLKSIRSIRFHNQLEAHHNFSAKITAGEAALIERAIKMQYEALKYEFDCQMCIHQFSKYLNHAGNPLYEINFNTKF